MIAHALIKEHSADAEHKRFRFVRCAACGCEFAYIQKIKVESSSMSVRFIAEGSAEERAKQQAQERLQAAIANPVHIPIPCPRCSAYQQEMVREACRLEALSWVIVTVFLLAIPCLILAIYVMLSHAPSEAAAHIPRDTGEKIGSMLAGAVGFVIGAGLLTMLMCTGLFMAGKGISYVVSLFPWDINSAARCAERAKRKPAFTLTEPQLVHLLKEMDEGTRNRLGAMIPRDAAAVKAQREAAEA